MFPSLVMFNYYFFSSLSTLSFSKTHSVTCLPHSYLYTHLLFISLEKEKSKPYCQGRRGDYQAEVRDDMWTMRVGEVGTDQHNTTLGNRRRDLTEG